MKQRLNEIKRMQQLAGIIVETKVGPRPGPITINAIANNSVTFYPEDFDTWAQFKEFCDRLRNDEDFKYDMFFANLDNSRTEWELTDITQRNRFM